MKRNKIAWSLSAFENRPRAGLV